MIAGAWGARAGELLERAAEQDERPVHRVGNLAITRPPNCTQGGWCVWLFGTPEDRGGLSAHFGLGTQAELASALTGALIERGEVAFGLLQGRFVAVALELERDRCVVVRDQLGAHPLIHTQVADGALFAEHELELLELLEHTPGPDRLALLQWIENGLTPLGRTLYEGLQRLPAGHRLTLDRRGAHVERWWDIGYAGVEHASPNELAERLREAAFAAVRRAAAGSERPAVKLSGGLDSACVAAGLHANAVASGRAIALGGTFSGHPESDERELIEATARHAQLPLELVEFAAESSMLAPALAHIVRWRLPPATPNLFLWQPVIARARELEVDRMLDGEGGDELFALAPYLIADQLRGGRLNAAWSLAGAIPGMGHQPDRRVRLRVLRHYGLRPLVPRAVQRRREMARAASSTSIVPAADAQALIALRETGRGDPRDGPLWWRFQAESLLDMRELLDMAGHFSREAADASIEVRHPLLHDLTLVETALRLPPRAQFDPARDRPLIRDGLSGLIPESVRTRHEKSHFTPLVLEGIRADEARLIAPLRLADAPVRAYVAAAALERKLRVAADSRSMLGAGPLWQVAIANQWLLSQADTGS